MPSIREVLTPRSGRYRRVGALVFAATVATLTITIAGPASAASSGAMAWGFNLRGQLGDGTTISSEVPVAVSKLSGVTAVGGGEDDSLALLSNGTVMAWGENGFGQLGNGSSQETSDVPVAVSKLTKVKAIAAGGNHNLALLSNGTVMAWGYNAFGQLGTGSMKEISRVPVAVSRLSGVTAIAAGPNYSLALLSNGTVVAWGFNQSGELGNGTTTQSDMPVAVKKLKRVTAIAAGYGSGMALLSNGTVMDWGNNQFGQLGNGTTTSSTVPVAVSKLSGVAGIAGGGVNLARLSNGTAMAWGINPGGQLGDGTTTGPESCEGVACSTIPVAVSGLSGVKALAGGAEHSLALLSSGTVVAWGANAEGQLGNGTSTGSDVPVTVSGLSGVKAIAAGKYHSLAAP